MIMVWTNEASEVNRVYYAPDDLTEEEKVGGQLFGVMPDEPFLQFGKMNVLTISGGILVWTMKDRPLSPEEKLQQLQTEKDALEQKLAQLNGDFAAFTDFYFTKFPEQA